MLLITKHTTYFYRSFQYFLLLFPHFLVRKAKQITLTEPVYGVLNR